MKLHLESTTSARRGAIAIFQALVLGPLSGGLLALLQDWYVDVNAPGCGTGTGRPGDPFCNIMDAVSAAADGDTIHIAPGTYFENTLLDKDLQLISTRGREVTILDGMASGSVVRVRDSAVTLTGLTLTNGTGTPVDFGGYNYSVGGGLHVYSPLSLDRPVNLVDCAVVGNTALSGAGIANGIYDDGAPLTILDSTVSYNAGQGILIRGSHPSVVISGSTVNANTDVGVVSGGLTLTNSTVSGNGAAGISSGYVTVTDSTISGNGRPPGFYGYGGYNPYGGIYAGSVALTNSIVSDNYSLCLSLHGGDPWASGITISPGYPGAEVTLTNSMVTGNEGGCGAIVMRGEFSSGGIGSTLTLTNTTVAGNDFIAIRGYDLEAPLDVVVQNSILWDEGGISFDGHGSHYGNVTVNHTLIEGGWPGTGNISADPLFVDPLKGDYRLLPGSSAIDAGDNFAVPMGITTDIRGVPRIINGTVDMGAYEYFERWKRANVPVPFAPPRVVR